MLGKKSRPVIRKRAGSLISGYQAELTDTALSPRSPLEMRIHSPRVPKSYDQGGVGLAIVAALEKPCEGISVIPANKALCGRNSGRSNPIPVKPPKISTGFGGGGGGFQETEMEEDYYTYVTRHGPNKSYTKVYCDGGGQYGKIDSHREDTTKAYAYPTSDFLSSCHLCQKKLHGKDIYMYRGEKAFCSTECRFKQIVADERREKCRAEASRSVDPSSSPCSSGQIFTTGILAI